MLKRIAVVGWLTASAWGQTWIYRAGYPVGCSAVTGFPDKPVCTVPDEINALTVPEVGGSYTDPNFGHVVRIIAGWGSQHSYSTPTAISPDNLRAAVARGASQVDVVSTITGQALFTGRPGSVTGDGVRWDAASADVYYYVSGTAIYRHTLSANTTEAIADFAGTYTSIRTGGTGDTSEDNWLAFYAPTEHEVCAINLTTAATYCADYQAAPGEIPTTTVDFVMMAKGVDSVSGKRYVVMTGIPAAHIYAVNTETGVLDFVQRGPEYPIGMAGANGDGDGVCEAGEKCFGAPHSDLMGAADGQQYWVMPRDMESPCGRYLYAFRLNSGAMMAVDEASGGGRHEIMLLHKCGGPPNYWVGNHIGCAKKAPYCAVSTDYNGFRDPGDLETPVSRGTHMSEIMIVALDSVRRLAQARSVTWDGTADQEYWSYPRVCLSNDGTMALWDTNLGYMHDYQNMVAVAAISPEAEVGGRIRGRAALTGGARLQ